MDFKEVIKNRVDVKGLAQDLISGLVWTKLRELADSTDNELDDAVLEMLIPVVDAYVDAELDKLLESALGPNPAA